MAEQENQQPQAGPVGMSMLTIQMFQLRHLLFLGFNP
jgi:hypothetical protein